MQPEVCPYILGALGRKIICREQLLRQKVWKSGGGSTLFLRGTGRVPDPKHIVGLTSYGENPS